MRPFRKILFVCVAAAAAMAAASTAEAGPILQLYLEGATYNSETETWELTPPGSSGGAPFRLWAIGNVSGPGGKGPILDVKLSAVYDAAVGDINISLTPTTAGGVEYYNGFVDPSVPTGTGTHFQTVTDGSTPKLGDGSDLPSHGEYGEGRVWQEFKLGDFTLSDSQSADFIDSFPDPGRFGSQINVYEVRVTPANGSFGEHPFTIHFDLYNHVEGGNHSSFAPFSHDGGGGGGGSDGGATIVPEPGSMTLLGIGLCLSLGGAIRRRKRVASENIH